MQRLLTEAASDDPGNHHYCWNHDKSYDVSHVGITYLFSDIGTVLEQLTEKPSQKCEGFSSLGSSGAEDEIRTRDPLLGNSKERVSGCFGRTIFSVRFVLIGI